MNFVVENTVTRGNMSIQTGKYAGLEGFTFELIRPATAPEDRPFWPAKVTGPTGTLWQYQRDHQGFKGGAQIIEHDGEMFVILVERAKYLALVLPIVDLPHLQRTNAGEWIGGRKLKVIISIKEALAEKLNLEPLWTRLEGQLRAAEADEDRKAKEADQQKARAAEEAVRAEARRMKEEMRAEIARRRRLHVFTSSGDRRHGLPVVGDEWLCLTDGVYCVAVESFDAATGNSGKPIEAFEVKKTNAKVRRENVVSVTTENPIERKASAPLEVETVILKIKGEFQSVVVAKDMDHVRALSDRGLNSGTLVAYPKVDDPNRIKIVKLTDGNIQSVTEMVRRSAQQ